MAACLKRSPLWRHVQLLPLTINMRLLNPTMHPDERRQQEEFANRILEIGEGRGTINETVQWPVQGIVRDNSVDELAKAVYPDLTNTNVPPPDAEYLENPVLLAPRNDTVIELNNILLTSMPGQEFVSRSADGGLEIYPTEYLNTIDVPLFRLTS